MQKLIGQPRELIRITKTKRGDKMVKFWLKGDRIHKYPVQSPCTAQRTNETLYDSVEEAKKHGGKDMCDNCFLELPK